MIDPVVWTETNRILKGEPFSFEGRGYLLQPYRDDYQDTIYYKGRQVEMSEFSMNWLLRNLWQHPYTTGLHAFPRQMQAQKFSKQRLDAAIKDSEQIEAWYNERESDQMMRKFVKQTEERLKPYNFYILGATWESRKDTVGDASRGISLDFIVYDERQDHPNDVETVLGEGASHSKYKRTLTLGTPKLPGTQFDQQWESSDKHYWHVKCTHCGNSEPLTMDNIMDSGEGEYYYGCRHCKKPLDRNNGIWLPTNPQKRPDYRGYHINQLMVCWLEPREIMKKWLSPTYPRRRFYNEVLGIAYGGDDVPITIHMMEACAENDMHIGVSEGSLYVGIDWGATSYMVVQNKTPLGHKLVDVEICSESDPRKHPDHFAKYLRKYPGMVKRVVNDAGPDITRHYNLQDALVREGVIAKSEVWACFYANPPAKTTISWNDKEGNVTVGRSEYIELVIDEVADKLFMIPGASKNLEKVDMLMDHFTNIAAVKSKNNAGVEFIIYQDTGPDHFLHAKLYSDVASDNGDNIALGGSTQSFKPLRTSTMNSTSDKLITSRVKENKGSFPIFQIGRRRR